MGIGAAVAPGTGAESDGAGLLNPLLGGENEAVQSGLDSNPVEFDGIKTGVVKAFPDSEELDGAAAAEPVADDVVRVVGVLQFGNVSETEEVQALMRKYGDGGSLDLDGASFCVAHKLSIWMTSQVTSSRDALFASKPRLAVEFSALVMAVEHCGITLEKYSKRRAGSTNEGCHRRKRLGGRRFDARKAGECLILNVG